jgi:hypothetical protein
MSPIMSPKIKIACKDLIYKLFILITCPGLDSNLNMLLIKNPKIAQIHV